MTAASGQRLQIKLRKLRLIRARDAYAQADTKGNDQVHVRKLPVRIEVGWIVDDRPSMNIIRDVPDRVPAAKDIFSIDLLQKLNRQVGCPPIHIIDDGSSGVNSRIGHFSIWCAR
jgi:hypothetical protein